MKTSEAVRQLHQLWKEKVIMPDEQKGAFADNCRLHAALQWITDEASIHADDLPKRIRDIREVGLAALGGCQER